MQGGSGRPAAFKCTVAIQPTIAGAVEPAAASRRPQCRGSGSGSTPGMADRLSQATIFSPGLLGIGASLGDRLIILSIVLDQSP